MLYRSNIDFDNLAFVENIKFFGFSFGFYISYKGTLVLYIPHYLIIGAISSAT